MPMTECPDHGLVYTALYCQHLTAAYEANRSEPVVIVFYDFFMPWHLCSGCASAAANDLPPLDEERRWDWMEARLGSIDCYECFAAWFARAGHGDLLEAVRQARRRDGLASFPHR